MFFLHFVYHILWCCVLCIYTFLSRFQLLIMNEMIFCAYGRPMGHLFFLLFSYVIFLILCKLFLLYFTLYGIHVHIHIFVHTMEACNKDYYYYYYYYWYLIFMCVAVNWHTKRGHKGRSPSSHRLSDIPLLTHWPLEDINDILYE